MWLNLETCNPLPKPLLQFLEGSWIRIWLHVYILCARLERLMTKGTCGGIIFSALLLVLHNSRRLPQHVQSKRGTSYGCKPPGCLSCPTWSWAGWCSTIVMKWLNGVFLTSLAFSKKTRGRLLDLVFIHALRIRGKPRILLHRLHATTKPVQWGTGTLLFPH